MSTIASRATNHDRSTSRYDGGVESGNGAGNGQGMSISMQPLSQERGQAAQQQRAANGEIHPTGSMPNEEALRPKIRIFTHNVWGLKHLSPCRAERLSHIAHLISTSPHPPDIVCLQECWTYRDYALFRRLVSRLYPHGKFYHSGCFGGGLVILSRWRIVETEMRPYRLNGRPSAFWRGDWFVGKGVAVARIALPRRFWGGEEDDARARFLEVLNTHLHAPYDEGREGKDTYTVHRVAQAWQMARMMRHALERGNLVVACGDFNMSPGGIEGDVIRHQTRGCMRDVWRERFPDSSLGAWIQDCEQQRLKELDHGEEEEEEGKARRSAPPTVQESLGKHGHTCDSVFNTWRWEKRAQRDLLRKGIDRVVGLQEEDPRAKRLDYIFFGDGGDTRGGRRDRNGGKWVVGEARICMTERHPDLRCSLSDHFAVEAEITWTTATTNTPSTTRAENARRQNGDTIPHTQKPYKEPSYSPLNTHKILHMISTYTTRQRTHRRRRCIHFLASVVVTLASFVAIWSSPAHYVSFILLVLSSLGLMAGTVDGLIGLLFGGEELRALKEWEGEVRRGVVVRGTIGREAEAGVGGSDGVAEGRGREDDGDGGHGDGFGGEYDEEVEVERGRVMDWWG